MPESRSASPHALDREEGPSKDSSAAGLQKSIRAEVNLLRFPLFALHTKGLRNLDGIECQATITRQGQTHRYSFRVTRNTAFLYPGPLSRQAHFALLSIATERGLPVQNPITWTWRDLCSG